MKADAKPTLEEVAALLCKGKAPPEWVLERLRQRRPLIASQVEYQDDTIDRLLFESASHLQDLLQLHTRSAKLAGEEYEPCIDDIDGPLHELV